MCSQQIFCPKKKTRKSNGVSFSYSAMSGPIMKMVAVMASPGVMSAEITAMAPIA